MSAPDVVQIPRATLAQMGELTHPQTRVMLFYLQAEPHPEFDDGVVMSLTAIAQHIGMNRSLLARTMPDLIAGGWLRLAGVPHGNVRYYALGHRVTGETRGNVVALRRSA